jgi:hypothetical protein
MRNDAFGKLVVFLDELEQNGISYTLAHHRDEAIMVNVAVPGERWEIEFLSDGSVEVERFISHGEMDGEEALNELFARCAEGAAMGMSHLAERTTRVDEQEEPQVPA